MRLASDGDAAAWDEFVFSSSHGSFLQSHAWGVMQDALDVPYWRLIARDSEIRGVALVVRRELPFGGSWLYIPRGPVFGGGGAWDVMQEKLISLSEDQQALFVRMDPVWEKPIVDMGKWRKAGTEVQPRNTLLLDLNPSEDELLSSMHSKTRYNVRLAEKKGVTVRFSDDVKDIDVFLQLSRSVSGRSSFHYHPDDYYRIMLESLASSGMIEIGIAEYGGKALAAHIMIYAGEVATYAHGASSNELRNLMAPSLLYWRGIRRAKERGMKTYDFFGVAPLDAGDDHPWSGITRLKSGFGGKRAGYIGAYDLVMNDGLYSAFTVAKKVRMLFR